MSFPTSTYTDIVTSTLEKRSGTVSDNVSKNNAVYWKLKKSGNFKSISGGRVIVEEFSFAENGNFQWYSGAETLSVNSADVLSAAEFPWKQCACAVTLTGLEDLQNDGEEAVIDLLETRVGVAEATMINNMCVGLYSDGTGSGGKQVTGLAAAVPQDPTTGTYGGINRATAGNTFWRSQLLDPASTPIASTIQASMNTLWASCTRGADHPDIILAGGTIFNTFMASLQAVQMITDAEMGQAGFTNVKYLNAPVVLDGGIGGGATATDMYFLNTKYLKLKSHKRRNMVPLAPGRRFSLNQDVEVSILAWAGNLTCSGPQFSGRLKGD